MLCLMSDHNRGKNSREGDHKVGIHTIKPTSRSTRIIIILTYISSFPSTKSSPLLLSTCFVRSVNQSTNNKADLTKHRITMASGGKIDVYLDCSA